MVSEALIKHVFADTEKWFCVIDDTLCIQSIFEGSITTCTAAGVDRIFFDDCSGIEITKHGDGKSP